VRPPEIQIGEERVLDFDMESVAAGFADPEWVPQKITCIAWSWIGSDQVEYVTCGGSAGLYEKPQLRSAMIRKFLRVFNQATMVTGHNLLRHDLPVLNAECMRLGVDVLEPIRVQDTMRFSKTKGFKKGQDNIAGMLRTYERKKSMDWQQWEDAYAVKGWPEVIERAVSDVTMHKQMRHAMKEAGWLKPSRMWYP
jgi:hypothetical protein